MNQKKRSSFLQYIARAAARIGKGSAAAILVAGLLLFAGCSTADLPETENFVSGASGLESADFTQTEQASGSTQEVVPDTTEEAEESIQESTPEVPTEDAACTEAGEVALYLHLYGHLPDNYLTKQEAEALGWDSSRGNLWEVAPGCCIGGNRFGNYEGALPDADGRKWYECDVNYEGGYRGAERLLYSSDGLIYYTADHYETFELWYGEE